MRRPILLIAAVLTGALVALVVVGVRVLDRDRDRLYERYARERLHILEEAGRMLARDVREVAVDLDLAAALLEQVDTDLLAERELQAVATIKREYLMLEALRTDGRRLRVVAADAPRGIDARVGPAVADLLARAARAPGTLEVSDALGSGDDPASWYRVIARWPPGHQDAIAAVVDARVLSRLPRRAARPDVEPVRRRRSPHHAAGGRPAAAALPARRSRAPRGRGGRGPRSHGGRGARAAGGGAGGGRGDGPDSGPGARAWQALWSR